MTSGLRKIHKYVWIGIVLILPVLMFLSIKKDPNSLVVDSINEATESSAFIDANEFVNYHKKGNQLTLFIKKPIKSASSALYELKDGKKGVFLGEIVGANRTYVFNVDSKINGFLVYDVIKESIIFKINF